MRKMIVLLAVLSMPNICLALEGKGAVPVRIDDGLGTGVCINYNTDQVWLRLRRIITSKKTGLLSKDTSAGIVIRTTIVGNTGGATQTATFPNMKEVTVEDYQEGQGVSIPLEANLLNGLELNQGTNTFTNTTLELSVMKKQRKTAWAVGLGALAQISNNLALPANPFAEGFKFFTSYADSVVSAELKNKNNAERIAQVEIGLTFSPNGDCTSDGVHDFDKTGTIAIIQATKEKPVNGFVDISKTNDYCWKGEPTPAFTLKYALKKSDGTCPTSNYQILKNNYYAFVLMAVRPTAGSHSVTDGGVSPPPLNSLVAPNSLVENASLRETAARCKFHGLSLDDCLGRK